MKLVNSLFQKHLDLISKSTSIEIFEKRFIDADKWLLWLKKNSKVTSKELNLLRLKLDNLSYSHDHFLAPSRITVDRRSILFIFFIVIVLFVFILFALFTIITTNRSFYPNQSTLNSGVQKISSLFFEGTFTNADGSPVTTSSDLYFSLYLDESDTEPFYTGSCVGESALTPDFDGTFAVLLGEDCNMKPIPTEELSNNSSVWLGVRVSNDPELKPRKRLFTSVGDTDARSLSGLERGTTNSSVLFLDDNGELVLDSKSPSINSTDGIFSIKGKGLMLETTDSTTGTIFIQPAGGANTIISSGNMGVGTFDPKNKLSVVGAEPYSSIASFRNIAPSSEESSVLELGIGESIENKNSTFVNFYSGASQLERGVKVGSISLNNGRVAYVTTGADFAEYFKYDGDIDLEPGMIIGISPDGIAPADIEMPIIGVVSATPGFIGNVQPLAIYNNTYILIGLVGQVDVLVTTENGEIEVGDKIGISDIIQGFGAKNNNNSDGIAGIVIENNNLKSFKACPKAHNAPHGLLCGKVKMLIRID